MGMTEKERLKQILEHGYTDRPACICPGGMMNMIITDLMERAGADWPQAHTDPGQMAKLAAASFEAGCFENIGVPFCMTIEAEALGAKIAMGTKNFEPHVEDYAIESVSHWDKLMPGDFQKGRAKVTLEAIKLLKEKFPHVPIVGNVTGPVSTASSLMEPTVFYKELRKKNEEAHRFMQFVTEQITEFANAQILAGADLIAVSDPSGTGEILGPALFDEFAVTYINELLKGLAGHKMGTVVHICGQMKSVYRQVNKINSDVLSFDSIVAMKDARAHIPGRLLMGNVSTYALEFGTVSKVMELTRLCADAGADILSPACGLGTKTPIRNVRAMLQELKGSAV